MNRVVLLSVVVPAFNEQGNIGRLADEVAATLSSRFDFEMVFVDDCSSDGTFEELVAAQRRHPQLRVLRHATRAGQSLAVRNGVKAARGLWIATLDGDGQNDPADLHRLLDLRARGAEDVKCFAGWQTTRMDAVGKRLGSRAANAVRSRILRDSTPDTGCGIKLFERDAFLDLPYFDHMHRYIPALLQRAGWRTTSVPVRHRPRLVGASKYGNLGRLLAALSDMLGVLWLQRRGGRAQVSEHRIDG